LYCNAGTQKSEVQASWELGDEVVGDKTGVIYEVFWCNFELKWGLYCNPGKKIITLDESL
jgi:hypothetical protein